MLQSVGVFRIWIIDRPRFQSLRRENSRNMPKLCNHPAAHHTDFLHKLNIFAKVEYDVSKDPDRFVFRLWNRVRHGFFVRSIITLNMVTVYDLNNQAVCTLCAENRLDPQQTRH